MCDNGQHVKKIKDQSKMKVNMEIKVENQHCITWELR
jgi:hypothetical protein